MEIISKISYNGTIMRYIPTIGLEIHIEPKTKSKMFCDCPNDSGETQANRNTCPICLGHPGAMPVANLEAIKSVIRFGLALGGKIAEKAIFDRKSYFYPDLPKGYQISQYEHPFVEHGELLGVHITRVHLEEDAGKLVHGDNGKTFVDFNRGGVPLMELVTDPDVKDGDHAVRFAKELQMILRYLGISNADMEKGEMRLEANISIRPEGQEKLGTKVEVKNLNSFKSLHDAIDYEIKRQEEVILSGERIIQETRGWDAINNVTFSQRSKEGAQDYRYLPEPDLPPVDLTTDEIINLAALRASIPELPESKRRRFESEYGISFEQAALLVEDKQFAEYFEEIISEIEEDIDAKEFKRAITTAANYVLTDLKAVLNNKGMSLADNKATPENMADLAIMIIGGELTSRMAKDIMEDLVTTDMDPRAIMEKRGMKQVSDAGSLLPVIQGIVANNPKAVSDYKSGKTNASQFLFGLAMKELKGQGNPDAIRKILEEELNK